VLFWQLFVKILIVKLNKMYMWLVLGFFGVVFMGFMAIKVVPTVFVTWTKAAPATKVSLNNSYFIGGKILARADGVEKCVVNVFVLDASGKGVKGVMVALVGMESGELQVMSDSQGKAAFEITSVMEGQFVLNANIGGVPLDRTLKVTFRN
jgi:hypothetical protein